MTTTPGTRPATEHPRPVPAADGDWIATPEELAALHAAGEPVHLARRPRRDGHHGSDHDLDRAYTFVSHCTAMRLVGDRLDTLVDLWTLIERAARNPPPEDILLAALRRALPAPDDPVCAVLAAAATRTCRRLRTAPPPPLDLAADLHALWLRITCAATGHDLPTPADCAHLGRVAALLNPSAGGLTNAYLPGADALERDRVDVLVANVAVVSHFLLASSSRVPVVRYLSGCATTGMTDRSRAEVARYGHTLEAAHDHTDYTDRETIDPAALEHSADRLLTADSPNAPTADVTRWIAVTRDAVRRMPTSFTEGQAASNGRIMLAVRDAVHAVQPVPDWGEDLNWGVALSFVVSIAGHGLALDKARAIGACFAFYVSIEKARDAVRGPWCNAPLLPDLDAPAWAALTAGWDRRATHDFRRAHVHATRLRRTTVCRALPREPHSPADEHREPRPGPTFHDYLWTRVHDGFWPPAELFTTAELAGPADLLSRPDFWIECEASVYAFEIYHARRRKFEDLDSGAVNHLVGPRRGRITWAFHRTLELLDRLDRTQQATLHRPSGMNLEGSLWHWAQATPGSPTWRNFAPSDQACHLTTVNRLTG